MCDVWSQKIFVKETSFHSIFWDETKKIYKQLQK